jgi:hypothetical protein
MSMLIQRHKAANDIAISNQKKKAGDSKWWQNVKN